MAPNQNLRAADSTLKQSRLDFIQNLNDKEQFEIDCKVIIPELERRWQEKIIIPFKLSSASTFTIHVCDSRCCCDTGCGHTDELNAINWKHYLYNYTPQLLVHGINRVAARLGRKLEDGPVVNLNAYFKNVVQDLRRKELKKMKTVTFSELPFSSSTQ
jgi:hypothetical protein